MKFKYLNSVDFQRFPLAVGVSGARDSRAEFTQTITELFFNLHVTVPFLFQTDVVKYCPSSIFCIRAIVLPSLNVLYR